MRMVLFLHGYEYAIHRLEGSKEAITLPGNLEGQGDLVSRLTMGIIQITIWVRGVINLLTKSPCPSKKAFLIGSIFGNLSRKLPP